MLPFRSVPVLAACLAVSLLAAPAAAFPGFFAAKDARPRLIHETHVTLMIQGDRTVVTVMPDFEGPMEPFLVVLPVPADVTLERIKAFRREFIDRIDVISAPRYHEFWEMDPCEPGPPEQEWERNLKANAETAFLGGFEDKGATRKVDKEMFIKVEPQFKEGEYTFSLLDENDSKNLGDWMKREGWTPPPGALDAIRPHVEGGMRVLVAQVDTNKIELVGATKGILSPIRFWSTSYPRIPARLGLVNARDEQELVLYVLHPTERFEVKNFPNVPAPTNVKAKLEPVKERMGEFWAALHDMLLEKNPKAFILQYAWHSRGCGQPCPNAPLEPSELLTLGGDVFEQALPEEVRHPEPPEMTEEEKKALADAGRKEKKEAEEERKEVYRRKALIERLQYVVTRLHHRYDKATLTADPELGPASHLRGGIDIPKGQGAEIPTEAKQDARSQFQTRVITAHPWKGMMQCEKPERHRWGKAPRDYRGLRRIWVAQDTATRDRKEIKPAEVVESAVPYLGLSGVPAAADAGADGGLEADAKKSKGCGCAAPGRADAPEAAALALAAALAIARAARRRDG